MNLPCIGTILDPWRKKKRTKQRSCSCGVYILAVGDNKCKRQMNYTAYFEGGFPRCLTGKESACQCRRGGLELWIGKIPWRRKWHGQRSLAGNSPQGLQESDTTEHTPILKCNGATEKGQSRLLQMECVGEGQFVRIPREGTLLDQRFLDRSEVGVSGNSKENRVAAVVWMKES